MSYRTLEQLALKLVQMTAGLQPPPGVETSYAGPAKARALVARVLRAVFLPLEQLDGGATEHAFWSVCAVLLSVEQRAKLPLPEGEVPAQLEDADLVRLYRHFLAQHEDRLTAGEAAFLRTLGVSGVHLFNPEERGPEA